MVPPSLTVAMAARLVVAGRVAVIRERARRDADDRMCTRNRRQFALVPASSTCRYRVMFGSRNFVLSGELRKCASGFQGKSKRNSWRPVDCMRTKEELA